MCYVLRAMRGQLHHLRHSSDCLRGNPLGDPSERSVYVYTPESYDGVRRFPVIMLLPGYGSTHHSIVASKLWEPNAIERFDAQIARGEAEPSLLVMPDAVNCLGGTQFIDSPATGRYQTYLADEVFAFVDSSFRTIPTREGRGVAGRSSGGFGALRLLLDRPDVACAVASHAGDAAFEISMRPMLTSAAIGIASAGGVDALLRTVHDGGPKTTQQFDAMFVLASSFAYAETTVALGAPTEDLPLPVNPHTGAFRPDAWARWLRNDPIVRLENAGDRARSARIVFIDAGSRDEHGLQYSARLLRDGLTQCGARIRYEEFDGGHRGTSWRYDISLPLLAAALERG